MPRDRRQAAIPVAHHSNDVELSDFLRDSNFQAHFRFVTKWQVCLPSGAACRMHGWAAKSNVSWWSGRKSTGLSKPGRISGPSNSTLLDWGAQSEECWRARPGWEWWLPRHGCPKPVKCSTSPQEALWHSSLHFLNQSWVIRAATGKRTDQTIIPPHPPLYPFDIWQGSSSAAQNIHYVESFYGKSKGLCFLFDVFF